MKPILLLAGSLLTLLTLASCSTSMAVLGTSSTATVAAVGSPRELPPLTEEEINDLSCRTYLMNKDELYHRLLYRLQSKGCYISGSDKASGVITAKVVKEDKKGKFCQYFSFLVTPLGDNKTEVRMTIYVDKLSIDSGYEKSTVYNVNQQGMVRDKPVYDVWFDTLLTP